MRTHRIASVTAGAAAANARAVLGLDTAPTLTLGDRDRVRVDFRTSAGLVAALGVDSAGQGHCGEEDGAVEHADCWKDSERWRKGGGKIWRWRANASAITVQSGKYLQTIAQAVDRPCVCRWGWPGSHLRYQCSRKKLTWLIATEERGISMEERWNRYCLLTRMREEQKSALVGGGWMVGVFVLAVACSSKPSGGGNKQRGKARND